MKVLRTREKGQAKPAESKTFNILWVRTSNAIGIALSNIKPERQERNQKIKITRQKKLVKSRRESVKTPTDDHTHWFSDPPNQILASK